MNFIKLIVCCLFLILNSVTVFAQKTFVVKANEIKATIQPTMWGVFFEDINLGADGGIYAELVKNRSFEFKKPIIRKKVMTIKQKCSQGDSFLLHQVAEFNCHVKLSLIVRDVVVAMLLLAK